MDGINKLTVTVEVDDYVVSRYFEDYDTITSDDAATFITEVLRDSEHIEDSDRLDVYPSERKP